MFEFYFINPTVDWKEWLNLILQIATFGISIWALIIAKDITISMRSYFLNKRTEVIFELVEAIRQQNIVVRFETDSHKGGWYHTFMGRFCAPNFTEKINTEIRNITNIYYTDAFFDSLKINQYNGNLMLPEKIEDIIQKFQPIQFKRIKFEELEYPYLIFETPGNSAKFGDTVLIPDEKSILVTFESFRAEVIVLMKEIQSSLDYVKFGRAVFNFKKPIN